MKLEAELDNKANTMILILANFPQRNPIFVFPRLRQDPKHEPMDDIIVIRNPILVTVGLRRDPKPEQMDDTKCMIPLLEVIGSRCGPKHKIIDDAKHMNPMLMVIQSRRDRNRNPLDEIPVCLDCFVMMFCWVFFFPPSKEGGTFALVSWRATFHVLPS